MSLYASFSRPGLEQGYVCGRCLLQAQRPRHSTPVRASSAIRAFASGRRLLANAFASPTRKGVLALLEERGYVNQIAGDRNVLADLLDKQRVGFYAGVDPTAPSLHLGHLLPFMVIFWLYLHGHEVISLVGGATARVGDPSGRLTSRTKTVESSYSDDFIRMNGQLERIWENLIPYGARHGYAEIATGSYKVMTNAEWLDKLNILDFLRLMGNSMRVGTMLSRDTVRNKLEKGDGMSFSEFTYPLLQAWDWWHLYRSSNVLVQIGGGDQYGNIVAGMDAIKSISSFPKTGLPVTNLDDQGKLRPSHTPMGLTVPLLTTSSGEKFGKSAGNAVWLDKTMTSTFDLYGFLLRTADEDVERYLKLFTFLPLEHIKQVTQGHAADPSKREPQHLLAREVLELVHGPEEALAAEQSHRESRKPSVESVAQGTESSKESQDRVKLPKVKVVGKQLAEVMQSVLGESKSTNARIIASGGVYIAKRAAGNGNDLEFVHFKDPRAKVTEDMLVGNALVLRRGKWKVRVVEAVDAAGSRNSKQ